jgi:hypothetical protein
LSDAAYAFGFDDADGKAPESCNLFWTVANVRNFSLEFFLLSTRGIFGLAEIRKMVENSPRVVQDAEIGI